MFAKMVKYQLTFTSLMILLLTGISKAQDENIGCYEFSTYMKFLSTTENELTWIVNACGIAGNAQALLRTQRATEWEGQIKVRFHALTEAGTYGCIQNAKTYTEVKACVESDTPTASTSVVLEQSLPIVFEVEEVILEPFHDTPHEVKLISPEPSEELAVCAIILMACNKCTVNRLVADIADCASIVQPTLFSDSVLHHAALIFAGINFDNITVSETEITGGEWAVVITSNTNKLVRDTAKVEATNVRNATIDITHHGWKGVMPPGVVLATAINTLNLELRENKRKQLTQYLVLLHRTFPGLDRKNVVITPRQVSVVDISPYGFNAIHASEVENLQYLFSCYNTIVDLESQGVAVPNTIYVSHANTDCGGTYRASLIAVSVIASISIILAIAMLATSHTFHFVKHGKKEIETHEEDLDTETSEHQGTEMLQNKDYYQ
jgi:hypothetical protein